MPPATPLPPTRSHRLAAVLSFAALGAAVVLLGVLASDDPSVVGTAVVLPFVALAALWFALTRRGVRRVVAAVVAAAALIVLTVVVIAGGDTLIVVAGVALGAGAVGLARYSLARTKSSLAEAPTPGRPVPAATRPVLIMNLKSGGGKAEQVGLEEACRARGIEPVVLRPGDDLVRLAETAIDAGADVIGMAGGDGSQALVADVAARRDVPHVVVPAGTRNHFALDLGLDRDDVLGALDAFGAAVERRVDLAEVNERVFVNNVSLGVYAEIVQSDDYRDAKIATTLNGLPDLLGPDAAPADLGWTGPDGTRHDGAHLIQVSNNRYSLLVGGGAGSRYRLDDGLLGIVVVDVPTTTAAVELAALVALRRPSGARALEEWTAPTFEVTSAAPVPAGVDGEALELEPPIRFRIRPGALRVRLPERAVGYSPAAVAGPSVAATMGNVWRVARGHAPHPPRT